MRRVTVEFMGWVLAAALVMTSTASARKDNEDPNFYFGDWYRIALDGDGKYLLGDGHGYAGGTWYYYPQPERAGRWRQWFYNEPYDPNRQGQLDYAVYITPVDPKRSTYALVRFNWSTPEWSGLGKRRPPLPCDVPEADLESRYMRSELLHFVENWMIETIEPVKSYKVMEYNPEWVSIDIEARNAYIYRGAHRSCLPKDPEMGACYNADTNDCYTCYAEQCRAPYMWLGPGSACSDYLTPRPFAVPVYRFWSPTRSSHLFTTAEREKDELVNECADEWTFEGMAYCVLLDDSDPASVPVHQFWSPQSGVCFYTIDEAEKDTLLTSYGDVWWYDGPAFYAYSPARHPADTSPVYRFWSDGLGCHFYTISEAEKDKLINDYAGVWTYEGIAWYAYVP